MKLQDLFEMSRDIPDIDWFSLNSEKENLEYYKKYVSKSFQYKKKLFDLGENVSVYQNKSEFFCLNHNNKTIIYYMKYQVDVKPNIGQYVWQSLVWTDVDAHKDYLIGLA